jgi:uncharacterized protein (TIGR03437 family)
MSTSKKLLFLSAPILIAALPAAFAQSSGFPGFSPGNIVVSRTVYAGDASTITVGQPLPPICPSTAACGTAKATDNGALPASGSTNNVWNNNKADGSFGITSPIFLDQMTPTGTLVNSMAIPANQVTTSFSSKSELALNLSTDGMAITFMGYMAPPNTIDVSNANTPGVYDPTNPAGGSYFRAVVQVGGNGTVQVTPTNAYCGNNGRAAMLSNGQYYMAGNSNNGSGTPANVVAAAGVQIATPGQAANTAPTQIGNFSITQVNDPSTGKPYPTADKAGKDNNFRGLTIFNNTLYVTKGSGGNGINTVYQVGAAGSLPTLANAATAPITILPGFPTVLAKSLDATGNYPFGIWFANATTLYVADEGDGVATDAAGSPSAGLQKWIFVSGAWQRAYVMQNGLNLGQQYSVNNYPASLNPATDGLRNLTGKVNSDGTVTIWAVTSTVSSNGDQGADPNKLVTITDVLSNTDPAVGTAQQFTTLRTAVPGEVLRGVALAPASSLLPAKNVPTIVSAATTGTTSIAPGSLAFAFGQGLATGFPGEIVGPPPTVFGGTSVSIVDSAGKSTAAPLLFVSPGQVTFYVPNGVAAGSAQVTITAGGASQTANNIQIAPVAPSLFVLNGSGLAAANEIRVSSSGTQTLQAAYALNSAGSFSANPISLGSSTDQNYLILFGTGLQAAGMSTVKVTVGGVNAPVVFAGQQGGVAGLDQVNVQLPASLAGKGNTNVQLTAAGIASNPVQVTIQ